MVLITGATGLLGSHICRELSEQNIPFKALKRANSDVSLLGHLASQIAWVEAGLEEINVLEEALVGVKTVIHCAAIVSYDKRDAEAMRQVNVEATRDLVNLCLTGGIQKFVYVSSVAALGRTKAPSELDENAQWQDSPLNTHYALTKYQAELEVWRGHAEGLPVLVVNPSLVLGEGDGQKSSTRLFQYVREENKYYTGGLVNYVDVKDVAHCVVALWESGVSGERFILSAGTVTYKELMEKIAKHMGKRPPSRLAKGWMLWLALWSESLKALLTGSRPKVTSETIRATNAHVFYNNHKVVKHLNYEFTPLEDTLERVVADLMKK
jgi:dihydroflavonol-4-reductase